MRCLTVCLELISENSKGCKCFAYAPRKCWLSLSDHGSTYQEFAVGRVLREFVVFVKGPPFDGAEHDERV